MVSTTPWISSTGFNLRFTRSMVLVSCDKSFERIELALQRDQHAVRRHHRVERQQGQRRRAVDENKVIRQRLLGQRVAQPVFPALQVDELDLGAGQVRAGRHDPHVGHVGGPGGLGDRHLIDQHLIGAGAAVAALDAEAGRGVALGVEIDDQHALAAGGEGGRQVDGGGGLADSALLVRHGDDTRLPLVHRPRVTI